MNEPTIDSAAIQSGDADNREEPVDTGAVKDGAHSDTPQDPDIAPLDSHAEPTQNEGQTLESSVSVSDGRLHAATLWLPLLEMFVGLIIPVLITGIFVSLGTAIFFVVCFGLLPTAAFHILRYVNFRYRVTDAELVLNSGVIFRRERRIPLDRVQEMEIHQGLVHRVLDLARLEITTAGSDAQEANLNVLSRQAAEHVKEMISVYQLATPVNVNCQVSVNDDKRDYVCQLTIRDLLLGGLTSRLVASLSAVIGAIIYFQLFVGIGGAWWGRAEQELNGHVARRMPGEDGLGRLMDHFQSRLPDLGPFNFVFDLFFNDTLPKSLSLVLLGLGGSVAAYVIRYHGFRLTRDGDLLTTTYGLLTLRRGSLPRDRIQAIKLEEGLLRRYFQLASIHVDSAGDRREINEVKKRDVLVPVAAKTTAHEIVKQAMPGLTEPEPDWKRVSPHAVLRGSKKGWLLLLLAMVQTYSMAGWFCLIWLPGIPLVYFLNYQWFRHTGYWLEEQHFLSRRGWLNRATVCLPVKNIQNISVTQSFFDRRLNLATLSIDTAGQSNTGGGPIIRHLPVKDATSIQRTLARRVADREFTW